MCVYKCCVSRQRPLRQDITRPEDSSDFRHRCSKIDNVTDNGETKILCAYTYIAPCNIGHFSQFCVMRTA